MDEAGFTELLERATSFIRNEVIPVERDARRTARGPSDQLIGGASELARREPPAARDKRKLLCE